MAAADGVDQAGVDQTGTGGVLRGRRLLVTGASSGIGRATAVACLDAGAAVAVLARREGPLHELASARGAVPIVGDVTDLAGVRGLVDRAAADLGGLDGVVSSAGIMRPGLIAEADPADWRAMFDVNVLGLLAVTQAALPHLRQADSASIVNVSSMSGRRIPSASAGVYAATKHAVHAIGEALRQELQGTGIRVTTVAPGFVATDIFADVADTPTGERFHRLANAVGIQPEDVAAAVVHALSAPPWVAPVEIALVPTSQDDSSYSGAVESGASGDDR